MVLFYIVQGQLSERKLSCSHSSAMGANELITSLGAKNVEEEFMVG